MARVYIYAARPFTILFLSQTAFLIWIAITGPVFAMVMIVTRLNVFGVLGSLLFTGLVFGIMWLISTREPDFDRVVLERLSLFGLPASIFGKVAPPPASTGFRGWGNVYRP